MISCGGGGGGNSSSDIELVHGRIMSCSLLVNRSRV